MQRSSAFKQPAPPLAGNEWVSNEARSDSIDKPQVGSLVGSYSSRLFCRLSRRERLKAPSCQCVEEIEPENVAHAIIITERYSWLSVGISSGTISSWLPFLQYGCFWLENRTHAQWIICGRGRVFWAVEDDEAKKNESEDEQQRERERASVGV